jgi:hypothetical protein
MRLPLLLTGHGVKVGVLALVNRYMLSDGQFGAGGAEAWSGGAPCHGVLAGQPGRASWQDTRTSSWRVTYQPDQPQPTK